MGGPLQGRDEVVVKEELTARGVAGGLDGPEDDGGVAWAGRTGWRVEERPKKTNPAVDNSAVTVPKFKSKGNKRVEVGGSDKRLG